MLRKYFSTCAIRKGRENPQSYFSRILIINEKILESIIVDVNVKSIVNKISSQFRALMASSKEKQNKSNGETVRKVILSQCAPKPVGPYSQAILFDKTLYVSGVLGLDKNKMKLVEGSAADQTKQALINMGYILKAAGASYESVIKTTIFLANIDDFKDVNDVYKEFFCSNPPARSTYQVAKLPLDAMVEIEAIAGTGEIKHESCNCGSK